MDIVTYTSKKYLMLVAHFSDFFQSELVNNQQFTTDIKLCKKTITIYGIPHQLYSDNGWQIQSRIRSHALHIFILTPAI